MAPIDERFLVPPFVIGLSIFIFVFESVWKLGFSAPNLAYWVILSFFVAVILFIWWTHFTRKKLVEIVVDITVGERIVRLEPSVYDSVFDGVMWRAPSRVSPTDSHEPLDVSASDGKQTFGSIVCIVLAFIVAPIVVNAFPPWSWIAVSMPVGLLMAHYRSLVLNPLRSVGRWSIFADPERIEIPRWLWGSRVFRWDNATLALVGVHGRTARAVVVDRETREACAFNFPSRNLGALVGLAVASSGDAYAPDNTHD